MLVSLEFPGQRVNDREEEDITHHLRGNSIRLLSLRGCSMTDETFARLCAALKSNESLQQLNLNMNVVSNDRRVKELGHALQRNASITSLMLHGTSFSKKQVKALCKAVDRHPSLTSLDMGDCGLNNSSLKYLCQILQQSDVDESSPGKKAKGLTELNLSGNAEISLPGWTRFSIALSRNETLERLYLDYCRLLPEGAAVLAVAIARHPTLRTVDVEGCSLAAEGAGYLSLALKYPGPPRLEEILLSENSIPKEDEEKIKSHLGVVPETNK